MPSDPAVSSVKGAVAEDRFGASLGTVDAVFLDDATGQLSWVVVGGDAVVPAVGAQLEDGRLRLAVDAHTVSGAPRLGGRGHLDPEQVQALQQYWAGGANTVVDTDPATGQPYAGRPDDSAMTLSEERLAVHTELAPYSRAVLRIETVTEEVMVPVTVTRQRARVEHLPLIDPTFVGEDQPATSAVAQEGQATEWVTLWGEEPVVELRRTPVERVRLATSWTATEQALNTTLRHEELALEDEPARG